MLPSCFQFLSGLYPQYSIITPLPADTFSSYSSNYVLPLKDRRYLCQLTLLPLIVQDQQYVAFVGLNIIQEGLRSHFVHPEE